VSRTCALPGCEEPVIRRPGETPSKFARRKCCCRSHGRQLRDDSYDTWPCTVCRKQHDHRNEQGKRRLTCSEACRLAARALASAKGGTIAGLGKTPLPPTPCWICGTLHTRYCGTGRAATCSKACAREALGRAARSRAKPTPVCATPGCESHVKDHGRRFCPSHNPNRYRKAPAPKGASVAIVATKPRESITSPEALDRPPGHLWRLRDEPPPEWRWSGGSVRRG
jgi:hypothetical protein